MESCMLPVFVMQIHVSRGKCLLVLPARVSGGHLSHLGYLQVSPGWPWLLPGVMEPSQ